jgi:hypothetical protein
MTTTGLDKWQQLYIDLRTTLVKERGESTTGRTGASLPKTFAHEPFIWLAELFPDVRRALELEGDSAFAFIGKSQTEYMQLTGAYGSPLDAIGALGTGFVDRQAAYAAAISVKDIPLTEWMARGKLYGDDATIRLFKPAGFPFSIPYHIGGVKSSADGREALRYLLGKWNECIRQAGVALGNMARFPTMGPDQTREWWSAMYQLMTAIAVTVELPRPDFAERFKAAARHALDKSAEAAGQLAADAATFIGDVTGTATEGFTRGFFENAGMTSYLVVGLAIFIYFN